MDNKLRATYYGIHWADGIAFIHQSNDPTKSGQNMLGLKMRSPFIIQPVRRAAVCNHNMPLTAPRAVPEHWTPFIGLCEDPLVRAMLPVPKSDSAVKFFTAAPLFLTLLSKMSSPTLSVVHPISGVTQNWLADELAITNVQPLCLYNVTKATRDKADIAIELASKSPRTLILAGEQDAGLPVTATNIAARVLDFLIFLPWETLGANVVRFYMKGELFNPIRKDQDDRTSSQQPKTRADC